MTVVYHYCKQGNLKKKLYVLQLFFFNSFNTFTFHKVSNVDPYFLEGNGGG